MWACTHRTVFCLDLKAHKTFEAWLGQKAMQVAILLVGMIDKKTPFVYTHLTTGSHNFL